MPALNKLMLIGNLTRDPDLRYTPKGTAVTEISLAINRNYLADGEKREEVTFVDVTFFGKGGEVIAQYVTKGNPIYVEGRLKLDTWDDKDSGQKRSRLKVIGEEFQFLSGKQDKPNGIASEMNRPVQQQRQQPQREQDRANFGGDDDIAF